MADVVRQDVVEVSFDIDNSPLLDILSELKKLKSTIESSLGSDAFNGLKDSANKAKESMKDMPKPLNDTKTAAEKLTKSIQDFGAATGGIKSKIAAVKDVFNKLKPTAIKDTVAQFKELAKTKLNNVKTSLMNIKAALTQGEKGGKGFVTMLKSIGKVSVTKAVSGIKTLSEKLKDVTKTSFDKLKSGLTKVASKLNDVAKKAGGAAFNGLKKVAGISFKALAAGLGAALVGVTALVKQSVAAYGDFEQLKGGVETLFGTKGAKSVEEYAKSVGKSVGEVKETYDKLIESEKTVLMNANNAYKSSGLSANAYMETVTSFSASLLQSLDGDTQKAAAKADMAMIDMSDNANKFGTSMESIQYAYSGFAKNNYTMLDNLKLGSTWEMCQQEAA